MIIVDNALKQREQAGKPIRVGLVGAGFMARGVVHQLLTPIKGIRLVAMYNRHPQRALDLLEEAGAASVRSVSNTNALEEAITDGTIAVADDPMHLCAAGNIDVMIECTGATEFGAAIAIASIEHGKHVILANVVLDATVGPLLKYKADQAGVVITNIDGDEPAVAMNLLRFVETMGYRPVAAGNIKGMIDRYRNPDTQREFAERVKQSPKMVTSYADGTKLSMETCTLANATGFGVARRGMHGHACEHVQELSELLKDDANALLEHGIVDYVVGAKPGSGAFVVAHNDQPVKQEYMRYLKMGGGPLYTFYTPFHLPHLEIAMTIGRAALFNDPAVTPQGAPVCDVVAVAKRDLRRGSIIDGIGGFDAYGEIDNAGKSRSDSLLPISLSVGCKVKRDIAIDSVLTYTDVELPPERLIDALRSEQDAVFSPALTGVTSLNT